jgi:uncharacterized protein YigA (DUF484 family)
MKINNVNTKLRKTIKEMFSNLENRSSIANANGVSRQRISQLVKKLYTKEEIEEIDLLIKQKRERAINLK